MISTGIRHIIAVVTLLAAGASNTLAEPIRAPIVPDGEVRTFQVRRVGGKDHGIQSWVRPTEEMESFTIRSAYKLSEKGRELHITRDELRVGGHHSIYNFAFAVKGPFMTSDWYTHEVVSPQGTTLSKTKSAVYDLEGEYNRELVHPTAITEVLRGYKFIKGATTDILMWVPDSHKGPRFLFKVKGKESVTVPAGTFSAWRVSMELDVQEILGKFKGLEIFIKQLLPSYTLWFADIRSKPLIRFEGQFGPRSTAPMQIHEMTSIEY